MSNQKLREDFVAGKESFLDESRQPLKPGKAVETSSLSPWLYLKCPGCKHSFRVGDRVDLGKYGAQHSPFPEGCPSSSVSGKYPAESAAFFDGLQEGWPAPADQRIVRLTLGSAQVAPPLGGFSRSRCPVCAHTFRPGDEVLICPCSLSAARSSFEPCNVAIHRDPMRKLSCWELWNPGKKLETCPITLRAIK
jgi:hypothetical protein